MKTLLPPITVALPTTDTVLFSNPYITAATSVNTRRAYQSDIRHYETAGGRLPATPEAIIHYLQTFAPSLNPRTLQRRIIALRHWHTYQQFPDPTAHPAIAKTVQGILRTHGKPKAKAHPLSLDDLEKMVTLLEQDPSLRARRDNAILQVGFFGAFRRSELVAIRCEDLEWKSAGIDVLLPQSKTDPTHSGQFSALPYGNEKLCPARALKTWLTVAGIVHGAIFRRIQHDVIAAHALTPLSINHILQHWAAKANLSHPKQLSSHSLRRGLATSAALAKAPVHEIMRAGRWKQVNTVIEYIEASERFDQSAAGRLLQHSSNENK